jgi:hypothetical protein
MALLRGRKDATFDYLARLQDAADIIATVVGKVATVAKIYDAGQGRLDARLIVNITGAEVATGNEHYRIYVQGSSSLTFATDVWNLGAVELGDSSVSLETVDTVAGRREIAFCNEVNGVCYRYIRVYFFVAGTIDTTGLSVGDCYLVKAAGT